MLPFKQTRLDENTVLRVFSEGVDDSELVWHRDRNDRLIEVIEGEGWKLQIENDIPRELTAGSRFFVAAREYHRVIKGRGDLRVRIFEDKDQNDDGKNDFEDVKIARMKASGMSDAEIKKKHPELYENSDAVNEADKMPAGYKAKKGTKRGDKLRSLTKRYKNALKTPGKKDDLAAIKARDNYEKSVASKPGYKSRKSKYSEAAFAGEDLLREFVRNAIILEKKKKKKKKKKRKPAKISSKVDKALKNKAKKHNAPVGALKAVYRKGIGAFYTSGSRPGQNPHSWAMGRVNSFLKGGKARQVDAAQWNQVKKHRKK